MAESRVTFYETFPNLIGAKVRMGGKRSEYGTIMNITRNADGDILATIYGDLNKRRLPYDIDSDSRIYLIIKNDKPVINPMYEELNDITRQIDRYMSCSYRCGYPLEEIEDDYPLLYRYIKGDK